MLSAERHLAHDNNNMGIHENVKGISWMYSVNNSETATQDAGKPCANNLLYCVSLRD